MTNVCPSFPNNPTWINNKTIHRFNGGILVSIKWRDLGFGDNHALPPKNHLLVKSTAQILHTAPAAYGSERTIWELGMHHPAIFSDTTLTTECTLSQ
jgi:hypothetical protein